MLSVVLFLAVAVVGGTASAQGVGAATQGRVSGRAEGTDGVRVAAAVSPRHPRPGTRIRVSIEATDPVARGALGYVVSYGDGTTARNVSPLLCLSTPHRVRSRWLLTHRYRTAGRYTLTVSALAACSEGRATVRVEIDVR
jgi:hypothetical protein